MEILTITCERDLPDMLLQVESINKFITDQCVHRVVVEDGSKSYDEWYEILSPFYVIHELKLYWMERPDLDYSSEFVRYPHRPDAKSGTGGLGWRRQQILKLQYSAEYAETERVLVLDSKNIFVRHTRLEEWPINHGNGEYLYRDAIESDPQLYTIKNWIHHLEDDHGLKIPEKFAMILETPFVWQTSIVRKMWKEHDIVSMFMNPDVVPNSEFHMYFFFVNPNDLDEEQQKICRVVVWSPGANYNEYIPAAIKFCETIDSPTHGLHRQTRQDMTEYSIEIYRKWLTDKGLDAKLVNDYMTWCR